MEAQPPPWGKAPDPLDLTNNYDPLLSGTNIAIATRLLQSRLQEAIDLATTKTGDHKKRTSNRRFSDWMPGSAY